MEDTNWHHVLTQDGDGIKLYLDGVLDENTTGTNSGAWTDGWRTNGGTGVERFVFGGATSGTGNRLWNDGVDGLMDEVRVYDNGRMLQRYCDSRKATATMPATSSTFTTIPLLAKTNMNYRAGRPAIEAYVHRNWFKYSNPTIMAAIECDRQLPS